MEFQHFLDLFIESLRAPLKNQSMKIMTQDLHKVTMNCSRVRHKFFRNKTETSRKEYKKQRNFCSNLQRKAKKDHFAKLDMSSVTDNKSF